MAEESIAILETGDEAPSFSLPSTDGETVSTDTLTDASAVLIVFTCNHCPYAQAKHPILNEIVTDYDDVTVVGISSNDPEQYPEDSFDEMKARVESGEIQFDYYLYDESQEVAAAYGAVCTPDPFLFTVEDESLKLAYHGRVDDAPNPDDDPSRIEIRDAIDAVLADEEIPLDPTPSRGCSIKWREGNEPDYWDDL